MATTAQPVPAQPDTSPHDTSPHGPSGPARDSTPPRSSRPPRASASRGPLGSELTITTWVDPLVDTHGHHVDSDYVERFWIAILGPTATWVLRRLAAGLDHHPDGYRLDTALLAMSLGLGHGGGPNNSFGRSFSRCVMFGLAHQHATGFAVRRNLPNLARRHVARLPIDMQQAHDRWLQAHVAGTERPLPPLGVVPLHQHDAASSAAAPATTVA